MKVLKKLWKKWSDKKDAAKPWRKTVRNTLALSETSRANIKRNRKRAAKVKKSGPALKQLADQLISAGIRAKAEYSFGSIWLTGYPLNNLQSLEELHGIRAALREELGSWGDSMVGTYAFTDGDVDFSYEGEHQGIKIKYTLRLPLEEAREHLAKASPGCTIEISTLVSHSVVCGGR